MGVPCLRIQKSPRTTSGHDSMRWRHDSGGCESRGMGTMKTADVQPTHVIQYKIKRES